MAVSLDHTGQRDPERGDTEPSASGPAGQAAVPNRHGRPAVLALFIVGVLVCLLAGLLGGVVGARLDVGAPVESTVESAAAVDPIAIVSSAVLPSVVRVRTDIGLGSGIIMDVSGHVLTNNHVIAEAKQISVTLADHEQRRATLVKADPLQDLAVLQIDGQGLTPATFASAATIKELRVGQVAIAVGNPLGLQGSVTKGVVSAVNRVVEPRKGVRLAGALQTDAAVHPGSSGGALAAADGQVIGINTAFEAGAGQDAGIGFAIPSDHALDVAQRLLTGRSSQPAQLGVTGGTDLTPFTADTYALTRTTGAFVEDVTPDGPAAIAGIHQHDLITGINGHPIKTFDELVIALAAMQPQQKVNLTYLRGSTQRDAAVQLS